jgi:thiol-disulfide isomerase/thioredoxin
MKYTVAPLLLFLLSSCACLAQSGFTIRGKLQGAEGRKVYIAPATGASALDSAMVQNGEFTLNGKVSETGMYALMVEGKSGYSRFILSNASVLFNGHADSLRTARVTGSRELADAQRLRALVSPFLAQQSRSFDSAFAAYNRGDSAKGRSWGKKSIAVTASINEAIARFIISHPNSFVSLAQLNDLHTYFGPIRARQLFSALAPFLQRHSLGQQLRYAIFEAAHLTALNGRAIQFSQGDTAGRQVSLSAYKGRYLLIDFWASWCGPCRAENPYLKKAYARFASRGFEILGVSLDNSRSAWLLAIQQDSLTWQQVSDLRGSRNAVAQKYVVSELPTNYLLDPSGKIIAHNLLGERLEKKLQELLGD